MSKVIAGVFKWYSVGDLSPRRGDCRCARLRGLAPLPYLRGWVACCKTAAMASAVSSSPVATLTTRS